MPCNCHVHHVLLFMLVCLANIVCQNQSCPHAVPAEPNAGRGYDHAHYSWSQTLQEVRRGAHGGGVAFLNRIRNVLGLNT